MSLKEQVVQSHGNISGKSASSCVSPVAEAEVGKRLYRIATIPKHRVTGHPANQTLRGHGRERSRVGKESGRGTEGNEKRGNKLADRKKLLPHWQTTKEFVMYSCNICGFTKEKV